MCKDTRYYINFRIIEFSRYNLIATFSASFSICCKNIVRVCGKQVILEYHKYRIRKLSLLNYRFKLPIKLFNILCSKCFFVLRDERFP